MACSSESSTATLENLGLRPVDLDRHALVADRLRLRQRERHLGAVAEEPLALAEHDGEDHQPQLVDQAGVEQRADQLDASVYEDVAVDLALDAFHVADA